MPVPPKRRTPEAQRLPMSAIAEPPRPASGSFFVAGGTIPTDARCYVRRRADDELYRALLDGEFCYVLTSRQMGKSSLMVRTALRLQAAGARVVILDLAARGQN